MSNKDKIKALSTRAQCREKISVWYGSPDNYSHGLREVITNSIDEINNNFESGKIFVELKNDNRTVIVKDTGRGIPLDGKSLNDKGEEVENYKLLFETLFAGSNYDNNENGKETGGVNGVGTCVLNHTSDLFKVISCRNGNKYQVEYKDGGEFVGFEHLGKTTEHGTTMEFKLSDEVYTKVEYDAEELKDICEHFAATNNKLKITFKYKEEIFEYNFSSIEDYFNRKSTECETDKFKVNNFTFEEEGERNRISFIIACAKDTTFQETYLNGIYLPKKGTINDGIIKGFRLCMNRYMRDKNMYEAKEKQINDKDVEAVINFIATVNSTNQSYEGQTKFATDKELYETLVKKLIEQQFEYFSVEQPFVVEAMAKAILINKRANERASASIDRIKKKLQANATTINNRIDKFVDCEQRYGGELFITEGDSAKGAIVLARDEVWQAAYPLRGKMKNVLKSGVDKLLENKEIEDMLRIFECGVEVKIKGLNLFDKDKLRWSKIIFATDADPDGDHIFCLGLTFIYVLVPTLIKEGKIYRLLTPLYEIRDKKTDEMYYAYNDNEKDEVISKLKEYQISRVKGLGEADSEVMEDCINMENPNYVQVTWDEAEAIYNKMNQWMGEDIAARKEIITENLYKYI